MTEIKVSRKIRHPIQKSSPANIVVEISTMVVNGIVLLMSFIVFGFILIAFVAGWLNILGLIDIDAMFPNLM